VKTSNLTYLDYVVLASRLQFRPSSAQTFPSLICPRTPSVYIRFEVFTAVTMKNAVFWCVTPCGSCKNRRFGGTSETSVLTRATWRYIPEDGILHHQSMFFSWRQRQVSHPYIFKQGDPFAVTYVLPRFGRSDNLQWKQEEVVVLVITVVNAKKAAHCDASLCLRVRDPKATPVTFRQSNGRFPSTNLHFRINRPPLLATNQGLNYSG
jgi:hypothetical protein